MSNEIINPYQTFRDDSGVVLASGTITFLVNTTTTKAPIYSDESLSVAQSNPYTLDAYGRIRGDVKFTGKITLLIKDSGGATVRTLNNVTSSNATAGSIIYTPDGTGAVATTVETKLQETTSVFDFMTTAQITDVRTGALTLDLQAAISAAYAAAKASKVKVLTWPVGDYRINSQLVFDSGVSLLADGRSYSSDGAPVRIYAYGDFDAIRLDTAPSGIMVSGILINGANLTGVTNDGWDVDYAPNVTWENFGALNCPRHGMLYKGGDLVTIKDPLFVGNGRLTTGNTETGWGDGIRIDGQSGATVPTASCNAFKFEGVADLRTNRGCGLFLKKSDSSHGGLLVLQHNLFGGIRIGGASTTSGRNAFTVYNEANHTVPYKSLPTDPLYIAALTTGTTGNADKTPKLEDSAQSFSSLGEVKVGMVVTNTTDNSFTYVTAIDSDTILSLARNIFTASSKTYTIAYEEAHCTAQATANHTDIVATTNQNGDFGDYSAAQTNTWHGLGGTASLNVNSIGPSISPIDGTVRTMIVGGQSAYDGGAGGAGGSVDISGGAAGGANATGGRVNIDGAAFKGVGERGIIDIHRFYGGKTRLGGTVALGGVAQLTRHLNSPATASIAASADQITQAKPPVVTLSAHGFTDNDEVRITALTSDATAGDEWDMSDINGKTFVVGDDETNSFSLKYKTDSGYADYDFTFASGHLSGGTVTLVLDPKVTNHEIDTSTRAAGTQAYVLPNGAQHQIMCIVMTADGGAATVTPDNLYNGSTITFDDVGDSALLYYMNNKWVWMGGTATLA